MKGQNNVILLIFELFLLQNYVLACVPAFSIKYIVKHRLENFNDEIDITNPVQIAKKDLEFFSNQTKEPNFRSQNRQIDTITENQTKEKTSETTIKPSTEKVKTSTEKSTNSTIASNASTINQPIITTFKPTLDDPNWIPGDFLDNHGNPKVIPPPPVTTVLEDFLASVEKRNNLFSWTGANFLINFALSIIFMIGLITILCLILTLLKRIIRLKVTSENILNFL